MHQLLASDRYCPASLLQPALPHGNMGTVRLRFFLKRRQKCRFLGCCLIFKRFFVFLNTLPCTKPMSPLAAQLVHSALRKPRSNSGNPRPGELKQLA